MRSLCTEKPSVCSRSTVPAPSSTETVAPAPSTAVTTPRR